MSVIALQSPSLRVLVRPDLGAGLSAILLRRPHAHWHPVLRTAPALTADPEELACFLMAPWSNRIADARFTFQKSSYSLHPNSPDASAIHGILRHRPFHLLDRSPVSVRLLLNHRPADPLSWPWPFRAVARYELDDASLACELSLTNLGELPMPAGLGFHPFWMRRLWDARDDVHLQSNILARYPLARNIPTAPPVPDSLSLALRAGMSLADRAFDEVFSGSLDGATISWPASGVLARFACSPLLSHAVLFAPVNDRHGPLPWFCLEPVSMVNDGFNLMHRGIPATGVQVLAPGESILAKWSVRFEFLSISAASRPKLLP